MRPGGGAPGDAGHPPRQAAPGQRPFIRPHGAYFPVASEAEPPIKQAWRSINQWTDYHSGAVLWALFLVTQIWIAQTYGDVAGATLLPWLVVLVATGWFLHWVPALVFHTAATVVLTALGIITIEFDLGYIQVISGVGIYLFGLLFLGVGRLARRYFDRSEAHRAEQEVARLLKEQADFKTRFMNMAAHELATPLTPVLIQLAALRRTLVEKGDEKDMHRLNLLERNVERLATVAGDLLDASRLQSGTLRMDLQPTPLPGLIQEAIDSCRELAQENQVDLATDSLEDARVRVDANRVGQVLFNLAHNALKFTPSGGSVRLKAWTEDGDAVIQVRDTGPGLTEEQTEGLFRPFAQFHRDLVGKTVGSGLGLYISRGIAESHGGTLTCHSDGPDQGSTFTLRLPLDGPPHPTGGLDDPAP